MKDNSLNAQTVDVDRIFLDQNNPRFNSIDDQNEIIAYLCKEEQVLPLAKDIAKNGLNPLEDLALLPDGDDCYIALEGNRRLCAIKILKDPDLAPTKIRNEISKAAGDWDKINSVSAVVFKSRDAAKIWLDRIHAGQDNGRGRKPWSAEQKARNSGYRANSIGLAILDKAENQGLITKEQRKGRLSVVNRYVSNPIFRSTLGIGDDGKGNITLSLSKDTAEALLKKFMNDIAEKNITTRNNTSDITDYAHQLSETSGVDMSRVDPRPFFKDTQAEKTGKKNLARDLKSRLNRHI